MVEWWLGLRCRRTHRNTAARSRSSAWAMSAFRWRRRLPATERGLSLSTSRLSASKSLSRAMTVPASLNPGTCAPRTCILPPTPRICAWPISSSSRCRRRSTKRSDPIFARLLAASRTVGGALKKGDIVVYESTVYPGATEEDCAPVLEAGLRSCLRARLCARLFPRTHQPGGSRASLRDDQEGCFGARCGHSRDGCRGLWLGRHRRDPQGRHHQDRRGCQGHREYPARSQHRADERTVVDLPRAWHRHRRCAGRGRHQMELPQLLAGAGRRPLHRRRSVLSDPPRRAGRVSSAADPCRTPGQ